jgi:PadR family transcriptional regulator PadR
MKQLRSEFKRGTIEMILLKLLEQEEMYGYRIVTELEKRGGDVFQVKEGTLYPVLYRLEDAGYISAYRDNPFRGVPRKYYKLTDSGRQHLQELVGEWREFAGIVDRFINTEGSNK